MKEILQEILFYFNCDLSKKKKEINKQMSNYSIRQ